MAFYDMKYRIDSKLGQIMAKRKILWNKKWERWDDKTHDTLKQAERRLRFLKKHKAVGKYSITKFKIKKLQEVL